MSDSQSNIIVDRIIERLDLLLLLIKAKDAEDWKETDKIICQLDRLREKSKELEFRV